MAVKYLQARRHESHDIHISSDTLEYFLLLAFHTLSLLHFPLLHFPPLHSTPAFSTPAFSTPAFSAPPHIQRLQLYHANETQRNKHTSTCRNIATTCRVVHTTRNVFKTSFWLICWHSQTDTTKTDVTIAAGNHSFSFNIFCVLWTVCIKLQKKFPKIPRNPNTIICDERHEGMEHLRNSSLLGSQLHTEMMPSVCSTIAMIYFSDTKSRAQQLVSCYLHYVAYF